VDGPGIKSGGARFSVFIQTSPGAYPASCTVDTGLFPGVKRLRSSINHLPSCSAEVKERVVLYHYYCSLGELKDLNAVITEIAQEMV
jgi:hypothetical protein